MVAAVPLKPDYILGLDLGQASDPSALAVLERGIGNPPDYVLRQLERFPLGTSYSDVIKAVDAVLNRESQVKPGNFPLRGSVLGVDGTGVGRAVVDLLRNANLKAVLRPVTITSGQSVSFAEGYYRVPKRDLVGVLQVLFQRRRLKWHESLPHAATLVAELQNFRAKITTSANEVYEAWREGDHDDLVLAVATAAWIGERFPRQTTGISPHVIWTRDPLLR